MKYFLLFFCIVLALSCSKKTGASDEALSIVEQRFSLCHLKDSLGESSITYLWSEYDSEHNSILCFQYGGCAIEYYYYTNGESKRDTFWVKNGEPMVDQLKKLFNKLTDKSYSSSRWDDKQNILMDGFGKYVKDRFPKEDDFIEDFINDLATNEF